MLARLAAQPHRRLIKTHTPLDGLPHDARAFFREGSSGAGQRVLDPRDLARYHARAARLAPADLLAWLHR